MRAMLHPRERGWRAVRRRAVRGNSAGHRRLELHRRGRLVVGSAGHSDQNRRYGATLRRGGVCLFPAPLSWRRLNLTKFSISCWRGVPLVILGIVCVFVTAYGGRQGLLLIEQRTWATYDAYRASLPASAAAEARLAQVREEMDALPPVPLTYPPMAGPSG